MSVRLKLTLSYAGFLMLAGIVLLVAGWEFVNRAGHAGPLVIPEYEHPLIRSFAPTAVVVLLFLLVFGLVGGWLLAGRMLRPLEAIAEATRLAATGSLSHRIDLDGPNDEFRELADSFDAMLDRLQAHVAEQQRFAANASHELRTPLAVTQTLLEVAAKDPTRDGRELNERLRIVNARAIELTEALLTLSRTDQGAFVREHVDLSLIAEEAVETLLSLGEQNGIAIEVVGEPSHTVGSHALLLQMVTNLLHNAIVHNLAADGFVRLETFITAGSVGVVVENTGPRLAPALVATLVEPFQRGTERIRGDHAGLGAGAGDREEHRAGARGNPHLDPP